MVEASTGLLHAIVRHDDGCPMLLPIGGACTCPAPALEVVSPGEFVATVQRDRAARRKAARAADKAMRKARREGGRHA